MSKIIYIFLFFINVSIAFAQINPMPPSPAHNHNEGNELKEDLPPHGGIVTESGKYNIEILFDPFAGEQKLTVWLLNQRNKVRSLKGAQAKITLNYKDGRSITNEMKLTEDALFSDVEDIVNPFNAIIHIIKNKKSYTSTFFFKGLNK